MKPSILTQRFLTSLLILCASIGSAESAGEKIKRTIDSASESFKKGIDQFGDDLNAIQNYLDNYNWKGMIQGQAASGPVTLSDFRMNGHHRSTVVKPGAIINADVICYLNPNESSKFEIYRVIVGYKGIGAQATIGCCLGLPSGQTAETFQLQAPTEPGFYEVRVKTVHRIFESDALLDWKDENGLEPNASTTIGILWVKS